MFISSVSWDGNADNAGMKRNDIVRKWDGREVKSVAELQGVYDEAMKRLEERSQVGVELLRKGMTQRVIINYRHDPDKEDDE